MGLFRRVVAALLVAGLVAPASALAQQPESATTGRVDPAKPRDADLPVSLDRIRRELVLSTRSTQSKDGLKIQYYVEVYGRAPRIELFTPTDNLTSAPVMYGGMTHQEFLNVVTPEEFRAPAADIPGAIAALIKWYAQRRGKPPADSRK